MLVFQGVILLTRKCCALEETHMEPENHRAGIGKSSKDPFSGFMLIFPGASDCDPAPVSASCQYVYLCSNLSLSLSAPMCRPAKKPNTITLFRIEIVRKRMTATSRNIFLEGM